jgi:MoaA/NifB/PqqE/SkfB family radical SAM enzyme
MPDGDVFPCHALVDGEFRCGNVRHESLTENCDRNGLLGRLQLLDVEALARKDVRLRELTRAGTCMASVYHKTNSLPVWKDQLL